MAADDLVTGGPRASANIMFSEKKKKYVYCCFSVSFSNTKPMNVFLELLSQLAQRQG